MRWKMKDKIKDEEEPFIGQLRVINRFLIFPLRLGNERRWLESAPILQEYKRVWISSPNIKPFISSAWKDIRFLTDNEVFYEDFMSRF